MPAAGKRKSSEPTASDSLPAKSRRSLNNKQETESADEEARDSGVGGELVYSGVTDFKAAKGARSENIIWQFSRLSCFRGISVSLVASSASSLHSIIVSTDGRVFSWGRGGSGQLGIGDSPDQVALPTRVESLEKYQIKYAATGASHTLVLTNDGVVFGFGANEDGQLGIGNCESVAEPTRMRSKKVFVKISCGNNFSMIVDAKGYLYSCGNTEHGRLGHGFPKEIIEGPTKSFENENRARRLLRYTVKDPKSNATKDLEDVKIVDVSCGFEHTLALDDRGRVFSWGFGGYGRLGHGSPAEEVFPRLINTFLGERRAATRIWAGACVSFALNEVGTLNFWGRTGSEAVMYPKPVDALRKKEIRKVGISSCSVMAHADDELYSWSFGPTLGQMALTDAQKSSSEAIEVSLPAGVSVQSLVCGHSFTLCIVDAGEKENTDKEELLEEFPLVELKE